MTGKETLQQDRGLVEKYKGLNKLTRNIALGVAGGAAVVGAGFLIMPALLWAGGDQIQISIIDRYQNRKRKKEAGRMVQSTGVKQEGAQVFDFKEFRRARNQEATVFEAKKAA